MKRKVRRRTQCQRRMDAVRKQIVFLLIKCTVSWDQLVSSLIGQMRETEKRDKDVYWRA